MSSVSNRFNEVKNLVEGMNSGNVADAKAKREELGEEKQAGESRVSQLKGDVEQLSGDKEKLNDAIEALEKEKAGLSWYNVFKKGGINKKIKAKEGEVEAKDTAIAGKRDDIAVQTDHNAGFSALQLQIDANIERVADPSQRQMGNRAEDWSAKDGELASEIAHLSRAIAENPAKAAELLGDIEGLKEKSGALATVIANETKIDFEVSKDMEARLKAFEPYVGEKGDAAGTEAERQLVAQVGSVLTAIAEEIMEQSSVESQVKDIDPAIAMLKLHVEVAQEVAGTGESRRLGKTLADWQGKLDTLTNEAAEISATVLDSLALTPELETAMAELSGKAMSLAAEVDAEATRDTEAVNSFRDELGSLRRSSKRDLQSVEDAGMETVATLWNEALAEKAMAEDAPNIATLMDALRLRVDIESATMGAGLPAWSKKEEAASTALESSLEALQGVPTSGDLDTARKAMESAAGLIKELRTEIAKDDETVALYESSLEKLTPPADDAIAKVVTSIKEKLSELQKERDGQRQLGAGLESLLRQVIPAELEATDSSYAASGKRAGELGELNDEHARMKEVAGSFVESAETFSEARTDKLDAQGRRDGIKEALAETQNEIQELDHSVRRLDGELGSIDSDLRRAKDTMDHHMGLKVAILNKIEQADDRYDRAKESLQDARLQADQAQNDYNQAVGQRDSAISNRDEAVKQKPILQAKLKGYAVTLSKAESNRDDAQDALKEAVKAMAAAESAGTTITVKSGENLTVIAGRYPGVSVDDIVRENGIADKNKIFAGQKLKIPSTTDKVAYAKAKGAKVKAENALKKAASLIAETKGKQNSAETSLENAEQAISQAGTRIQDAEGRMSKADSDLRSLRSEIDRRERTTDSAKRDLEEAQDQSKAIISSADRAEETYQQFSNDYDQVSRQLRDTREALDTAERREVQQSKDLNQVEDAISEANRDLERTVDSIGTIVDAMNEAIENFNDQPSAEGLVEVRRVSGFDRFFDNGQVTRDFERSINDSDFTGFEDFAQALQATVTSMRQTIDSEIRKENQARTDAEAARYQELMA